MVSWLTISFSYFFLFVVGSFFHWDSFSIMEVKEMLINWLWLDKLLSWLMERNESAMIGPSNLFYLRWNGYFSSMVSLSSSLRPFKRRLIAFSKIEDWFTFLNDAFFKLSGLKLLNLDELAWLFFNSLYFDFHERDLCIQFVFVLHQLFILLLQFLILFLGLFDFFGIPELFLDEFLVSILQRFILFF